MGESSKFERPTTHKEEDDDEEKYGLTAEEKYAYALERSEDSVRYISKDPLTGAASLSEFTTQLEQSLKMVRRWVPASLVYIDIDHFKRVNDTFGHSGGDVVLKKVCAFLMRSVRESDVVARIGGEEFAILLSGSDGFGPTKAEELRAGVAELAFDEYPGLRVTASFGVVSLIDLPDAATARKRADSVLYEAKNSGRNQVKVYDT